MSIPLAPASHAAIDRCYRPAFSDEQALAMLADESGRPFDSRVVTAFFVAKDRIIAAHDRVNSGESPSLADTWRLA